MMEKKDFQVLVEGEVCEVCEVGGGVDVGGGGGGGGVGR